MPTPSKYTADTDDFFSQFGLNPDATAASSVSNSSRASSLMTTSLPPPTIGNRTFGTAASRTSTDTPEAKAQRVQTLHQRLADWYDADALQYEDEILRWCEQTGMPPDVFAGMIGKTPQRSTLIVSGSGDEREKNLSKMYELRESLEKAAKENQEKHARRRYDEEASGAPWAK